MDLSLANLSPQAFPKRLWPGIGFKQRSRLIIHPAGGLIDGGKRIPGLENTVTPGFQLGDHRLDRRPQSPDRLGWDLDRLREFLRSEPPAGATLEHPIPEPGDAVSGWTGRGRKPDRVVATVGVDVPPGLRTRLGGGVVTGRSSGIHGLVS